MTEDRPCATAGEADEIRRWIASLEEMLAIGTALRDALGSRVTGGGTQAAVAAATEPPRVGTNTPASTLDVPVPNAFVNNGEFWTLTFEGVSRQLKHRLGFVYLQRLLQRPHHRFSLGELAVEPKYQPSLVAANAEVIDRDGRTSLSRRIQELAEELDEAKDHNDVARQEALATEKAALEEELRKSRRPGGRGRAVDDAGEQLRKRVAGVITTALKAIQSAHPALGVHLRASLLSPGGTTPCYSPAEEIHWSFSAWQPSIPGKESPR